MCRLSKITFVIAYKILQCTHVSLTCWNATVGYFLWAMYFIVKPQLSRNCPRKKGSLGRFTFHLVAHSWKAGSVKSDTLSWACISLSHRGCETVTLWWVLSVSLLIPRIWHHSIPSAIRWHILQNCQNTSRLCKTECMRQPLTERCRGLEWKRSFSLDFVTPFNHDGYSSVFPPKLLNLDMQTNAS